MNIHTALKRYVQDIAGQNLPESDYEYDVRF